MSNVLVNLESVPLLLITPYKIFRYNVSAGKIQPVQHRRVSEAVNSLRRQIQQVDGFGPDEASEVKLQDDSWCHKNKIITRKT